MEFFYRGKYGDLLWRTKKKDICPANGRIELQTGTFPRDYVSSKNGLIKKVAKCVANSNQCVLRHTFVSADNLEDFKHSSVAPAWAG